ncbi:MAG: rod shape-determining protein MreD [Rhodospirillaceae bacterium]|nr:rod shape-determining protein MreD [Rhodospirillaceae bacterium]
MQPVDTGFWQKLDVSARSSAPAAVTVVFVLLGVTPLQIPLYGPVASVLPLIALYYWVIHRPDLLPFSIVFLVGILQDLLTGAPVGVNALVYLVTSWLILTQRRTLAAMPFLILWWAFAMVALLAGLLEWAVYSAIYAEIMPVRPAAYRVLVTASVYPILAGVLHLVQRGFLAPQRN